MKKLVVLSYGHGENTFPETGSKGVIVDGKRYAEHTTNAKVGEMTRKIVEDHGIKTLVVQPPNGRDVPLRTRTNKANASGAPLYYSFHSNAGPKSARGMCAFYWSTSKEAKALAEYYAKLCKDEGLPLYSGGTYASVRGTWTDFHELRETNMVAILSENLFMTHPEDFQLLFKNKDNFHERSAIIHAKVILKFFGVAYKGTKSSGGGSVPAPETKTGGVKIEQPKPKSSSTQIGLVDWMNKEGMDSSYSNREKLAKQHGISGYKGTADQNEKLLDKLQSGAKKASPAPAKPSGKGDMKTESIVEYLQSIGEDSSFSNRSKLAKQYGISGYEGTASQNTQLLDKMRGGSAPAKASSAPKPTSSSSGIKSVGKIKIVNVNSAAIIMDRPDAKKSKNLGTIGKGKTIEVAGSVKGKNSDSGYWEVIYNGKRAYVTGKMGQMV